MKEKLDNILFHPSTLVQYRNTHLLKVLLYLFILSTFSLIVPIIDQISNPELSLADKSSVESFGRMSFNIASDLPNCSLINQEYTCSDEASKSQEIVDVLGIIKIVSDVDDKMVEKDNFHYIKLTNKSVIVKYQYGLHYEYKYDQLPSKWQNFNFESIKSSYNPSDSLYLLFIGGFNQFFVKLTPFIISFYMILAFIVKILEALFYSLFFYLFYKRFQFKYKELFKITIFAQTLAITIGVIFDLLQLNLINSFVMTTLTFIYVYVAVFSSLPKNHEF